MWLGSSYYTSSYVAALSMALFFMSTMKPHSLFIPEVTPEYGIGIQ